MLKTSLMLILLYGLQTPLFAMSIPAVGSRAPDFRLQSQLGHTVRLKDYRGEWVVIFFYPFAHQCPYEVDKFADDQAVYQRKNAVVLGISVDRVGSDKNCTPENANLKLLADTDGAVSREYDSLTNLLLFKLEDRNTFIVDPRGRIAKVFTHVTDVALHSHKVLAALTVLQHEHNPVKSKQ